MRTLAFVVLATLVPLTAATALGPLDGPTITYDASPTGAAPYTAFSVTCSVDAGQSLTSAIRQSVANGCLDSATIVPTSFGNFLDCVNDVCGWFSGDDSRFWIVYENFQSTSVGIDDLVVDAADDFQISYDNCLPTALFTCVPNWAVP